MGLVARSVCSSSNSSPRLRAKREETRYSQMISARPLKSPRIPSQLSGSIQSLCGSSLDRDDTICLDDPRTLIPCEPGIPVYHGDAELGGALEYLTSAFFYEDDFFKNVLWGLQGTVNQ